MTGHCSVGTESKGLCAVWHEAKSGRTGNTTLLASSVVKLLEEIVKLYPSVTDFTLWSDSCVPQNKNSVMSCALIAFLNRNVHVKSITQKFGEPGHSPVQEVDNLHSQIERKLKNKDVFSPVGLLRVLKQVNIKKPLVVIQMRDFLDYQAAAKKLNFKTIPFSKVKVIRYTRMDLTVAVEYGLTFDQNPLTPAAYDKGKKSGLRK